MSSPKVREQNHEQGFVNIGLGLDGYIAPEGMTMDKPEYKNRGAKLGALMGWVLSHTPRWDDL